MTIHKLIAAGVDMPERLLLMSAEEIGKIEGIEPAMRREVDAYRSRFVDASGFGERLNQHDEVEARAGGGDSVERHGFDSV
jgi:hypothetical protein